MTWTTTFIGQQSWLVDGDGEGVLVDPVLTRSFGHSDRLRFDIHPARTVDADALPRPVAVVVSNEHLDHFHLPSLRMLPDDVPVLMPAVTPTVCVEAVERLGKQVRLLAHGERAEVGTGLTVTLFHGTPEVPVWESRVASVLVADRDGAGGVFVQSDTAPDEPVAASCSPQIVITTHNGQVPPAGHLGAFDNLLPTESPGERITGLELLDSVLNTPASLFPSARWMLFSGGGYVQVPAKHGAFLWADYRELEETANRLTLHVRAVGLRPGEYAAFGPDGETRGRAHWIEPAEPAEPIAPSDRNASAAPDPAAPLPPLCEEQPDESARRLILSELQELAPLLMLSPLGRELVRTHSYLGTETGPLRFAVHLRGFDGQDRVWALDLNTARFTATGLSLREAVFSVPAGIDVNAADLALVLSGGLHIWELATSRMRQWYLTDKLSSPVAFLYGALSEQVRPDLARRLFDGLLAAPVAT